MSFFSSATERIETEKNQALSKLIPVIYGAIFSYALYILAKTIDKYWKVIVLQNQQNDIAITWQAFTNAITNLGAPVLTELSVFILLYITIMIYMIEDVGGIIKLEDNWPFKRTSRYTHEILLGTSYITIFTLLELNSYLAIFIFSINVLWGGIWTNQFKQEYRNDYIKNYAVVLRTLHFFWGFILLLESGYFIACDHVIYTGWTQTICFISTWLLMQLSFAILPVATFGEPAAKLGVNIVFPDKLIKKVANWKGMKLIF